MTKADKEPNNIDAYEIFSASGGSSASYIDAAISSYNVISAIGNSECENYDAVQMFTAKVLVYIGCEHLGQYGNAVVRAIALFALHPNADMSVLGAKKITTDDVDTTYARAIKTVFNVNDISLIERIEKLTGSKIFTSIDAMYNLANYIRLKFSIGRVINA